MFWAWPHVSIDGKEYDLWMYKNIQQKFVRWLDREAGPVTATLGAENGWFIGDRRTAWAWLFRDGAAQAQSARDARTEAIA